MISTYRVLGVGFRGLAKSCPRTQLVFSGSRSLKAVYQGSGYSEWVGSPPLAQDQDTRDAQNIQSLGLIGGSAFSDPAGMTSSLPLRVGRGTGLPQRPQNHLPKLFAVGRS